MDVAILNGDVATGCAYPRQNAAMDISIATTILTNSIAVSF